MPHIIMIANFTDDYTWSCTEHVPMLADSPEYALVAFEDAYHLAKKNGEGTFTFAGTEYYTQSFEDNESGKFYPPDFVTVAEWFADAKKVGADVPVAEPAIANTGLEQNAPAMYNLLKNFIANAEITPGEVTKDHYLVKEAKELISSITV